MMITEYYNIHDIIKIQMNKVSKGMYYNINPEFKYFKKDKINNPDIIINVGKFQPKYSNANIVDVNYRVNKDYIYFKDKNYEVEVTGLENFSPASVNINPTPRGIKKLWPVLAYQNIYLRPLIEILAVRRGFALLHSAGVSDGKKSYLLTGRGGSGKTSLILYALKNGYSLLGEERTLIGNGKAYPYPVNFLIIDFWHKTIEDEYSRPFLYKYRTFKAFTSNNKPSFRISSPKKIQALYLIKRIVDISDSKLSKIESSTIIETLAYNNIIDWECGYMPFLTGITNSFFNRFIYSYLYINNNSTLNDYWDSFRNIIKKEASSWKLYEYMMPEKFNKSYVRKLFKYMRNESE